MSKKAACGQPRRNQTPCPVVSKGYPATKATAGKSSKNKRSAMPNKTAKNCRESDRLEACCLKGLPAKAAPKTAAENAG